MKDLKNNDNGMVEEAVIEGPVSATLGVDIKGSDFTVNILTAGIGNANEIIRILNQAGAEIQGLNGQVIDLTQAGVKKDQANRELTIKFDNEQANRTKENADWEKRYDQMVTDNKERVTQIRHDYDKERQAQDEANEKAIAAVQKLSDDYKASAEKIIEDVTRERDAFSSRANTAETKNATLTAENAAQAQKIIEQDKTIASQKRKISDLNDEITNLNGIIDAARRKKNDDE